jgi:hypothetical protein
MGHALVCDNSQKSVGVLGMVCAGTCQKQLHILNVWRKDSAVNFCVFPWAVGRPFVRC